MLQRTIIASTLFQSREGEIVAEGKKIRGKRRKQLRRFLFFKRKQSEEKKKRHQNSQEEEEKGKGGKEGESSLWTPASPREKERRERKWKVNPGNLSVSSRGDGERGATGTPIAFLLFLVEGKEKEGGLGTNPEFCPTRVKKEKKGARNKKRLPPHHREIVKE